MVRPQKNLDEDLILELAKIHCTFEEIAAVLDVSTKTLQRRYVPLINKGREVGKMSLRRSQFKMAETSPALAIWLGKQYLGQTEKIEQKVDAEVKPRLTVPEVDERQGAQT